MSLFHVTPRSNMDSITREGISPAYATGKTRAVWLVTATRLDWAILHVCDRYNLPPASVMIYECLVPEEGRTRRWAGIYSYASVIPVEDVIGINAANVYINRETHRIEVRG